MENYLTSRKILTYDNLKAVEAGTSLEQLVDVRTYDQRIVAEYNKDDMRQYTGDKIYVRDSLAQKLGNVNARLAASNLRLKVVYGYRHPAIQQAYFAARRTEILVGSPDLSGSALERYTHNFVAVPDVAGHPAGAAVDLTIIDASGEELDMGTGIADYSDPTLIRTFDPRVTKEQYNNRLALHNLMVGQGFAPFYGEWWHFSYGDREWAAFNHKKIARYGVIDIEERKALVTAAGGNGTAIRIVEEPLSRTQYELDGKALGESMARAGAEQAGFLILGNRHFEMAGGEFCGNASRAAALLFAEHFGQNDLSFTVSGFEGIVHAKVVKKSANLYDVRCEFPGMPTDIKHVMLDNGQPADIVDLGGIVHVVIEGAFPSNPTDYKSAHRTIMAQFGLDTRDAVGVVWFKRIGESITMHPVVWVRAIDTFFYEESCGSGTIAVGRITGVQSIIQPTGKSINAVINDDVVVLQSEMEIIH
jgi:D-alanyl-D-alanine dipeptidase/diaminopimelate epimerase